MKNDSLQKFKDMMKDPKGNYHYIVNLYNTELERVKALEKYADELNRKLRGKDRMFDSEIDVVRELTREERSFAYGRRTSKDHGECER